MNRTLLLIIFYILCYPFLHSDGQVKAQVPSANASDSLTLLAFQKTLTEKGWPLLWDTSESKKLKDWDGVIVDLTTGVVNSLRVGYRSASDPVGFTADSIPPESLLLLKNMTGMKSLSFSVLGIKNIPREIGELIGLETLNLSYNQLSTLPPEINRLSQLKYLFLSNNLFADLPDISGLTQLVDLSLTLNRPLHRIPNAVFSLENLEELGVSFNRNITEIPEDISKLTKLKVLRANAMQLKELPDAIGSLPELEELLLSNNQLENLPESIGSLGKLKKLDLSINLLTEFPDSFINLTKLSGLNLSRNRLSSLPEDFSRLRFLQSLSLDENRFGAIPSVLDDMGQLSLLSMKDNGLKGGIPEGILRLERRVILDNNELSGKIPLRNGRIPSWLHVSNNRFTLRDIEEHFHLFNSENPLEPLRDLRFQPQKRIGTFRTLRPAASASVSLSIEGYESLAGNVFTWYRYATLRDEARPVKVGSTEVLELPVFGPETEGGFYFCRVSNPRLKNLELESERIRVIGKDLAPVISAPDLRFREGQEGTLSIDIRDDFTVKGDLSITVPLETEHFLIELLPTDSNYRITAKSPAVYGTDSLTVSASDESGNTTERTIGITLLPIENEAPRIDFPVIHMSNAGDLVPDCTPSVPGCDKFYYWISNTPLEYFVTDDLTEDGRLTYVIKEADPLTGKLRDNPNAQAALQPNTNGAILQGGLFFAQSDTTFTVTLEVTDREGASSQAPITFICNGGIVNPKNEAPTILTVPEQLIAKGSALSGTLDLRDYFLDDYVAKEYLGVRSANRSPGFRVQLEDGLSVVRAVYPDSIYADTVRYAVFEKTNLLRESVLKVPYRIVEGVSVSGSVRDTEGGPFSGVRMSGFPYEVLTDAEGKYRAEVLIGWSGAVSPVLEGYTFSPDTLFYENLSSAQADRNYTGTFTGVFHTISGHVSLGSGEQPMIGVFMSGLPGNDEVLTDGEGNYTAQVPEGWSGTVTPVLEGFVFEPASMSYDDVMAPLASQDYGADVTPITGLIEPGPGREGLVLHPNPSHGSVAITVVDRTFLRGTLNIYTVRGRYMGTVPLESGKQVYNIGRESDAEILLPPGIYLIGLSLDGAAIGTTRLVVLNR